MSSLTNGFLNGHGRGLPTDPAAVEPRFSDIPSAIDIPVTGLDTEEAVEVNLEELLDDPTELCTLLENEGATMNFWLVIALAYAKQRKADHAIEIVTKGLASLSRGPPTNKLGLLSLLCWLYLWKSREAPRVVPEGLQASDIKIKEFYLSAATGSLNEASRINPAFPPLFLARGVLYLLRASLHPPAKPVAPGAVEHSERLETLAQALKCFEDATRISGGRNMMAVLGRARSHFSLGRYADALDAYQEVLMKMPHLTDPDPRIGIGCCLWQLGFRDEAKESWERALDINPDSKIANILLGLYYIHDSSHYATTDPAFGLIYKKAMTQYTQKAFKLDKELPLTCATFGSFFLLRKVWPTVENLARKAIELTDVNAVASDGWYLLARKEHYQDKPDLSKANEYYGKAELARGGGEKGFLPARLGIAQIQVLQQDVDGAKFRLEKIIQQSKAVEAMMLLGALHAEDVFANQAAGSKEDKSAEAKKATALLEAVRLAWKDSQKKLTPDSSVLVYLARLYEIDQPEKALQCLQQVEQMSINDLADIDPSRDNDQNEEARRAKLREQLSPQLLNNIGCFQYQAEKHDLAKDYFQTALNACVRAGENDDTVDIDALVTTISYNLARTYEASGLLEEARQVYEELLERHNDYTDARTRLAYIELRQNPTDEGPKAIAALYQTDFPNLEVRALYGWYLSKSKKRTTNIAEDQEQRHYKHTLQHHDKHDRYSLTGMGNLYLTTAREMRRDTDQDKEKRRKTYEKAVEFYDKALQLDAKNAYAAQGIAIALAEDKKDLTAAVQIFSKVRDTVRDANVFVNLGHVFAELKQYSRSIESYETALSKDRASDPQILACLGRVWLLKGKQDRSASAMKNSLDYSCRALAIAPSQIHFKFNIAFVQIQLAQLLYSLPESQRTLPEVQAAAEGLDAAIESFTAIAQSSNPPYPKHDIEQRANMGRNTMRRQLERSVQGQREYEEKNAAKLQEAREAREAELRRREEEKVRAAQIAEEQKRKIAEERYKMLEVSRTLAERRAEEERRKEEALYTDDETGERVKRKKGKKGGKRKKKGDESETDGEGGGRRRGKSTEEDDYESGAVDDAARAHTKKKRKLFKSSEIVVDSSSDGEDVGEPSAKTKNGKSLTAATNGEENKDMDMDEVPNDEIKEEEDDEEEEQAITQKTRKKVSRRIADDEDEDEEEKLGDVVQPSTQNPLQTSDDESADEEASDAADPTLRNTSQAIKDDGSADEDATIEGNGGANGDDDESMADAPVGDDEE